MGKKHSKEPWSWTVTICDKTIVIPDDIPKYFGRNSFGWERIAKKWCHRRNKIKEYLEESDEITPEQKNLLVPWLRSKKDDIPGLQIWKISTQTTQTQQRVRTLNFGDPRESTPEGYLESVPHMRDAEIMAFVRYYDPDFRRDVSMFGYWVQFNAIRHRGISEDLRRVIRILLKIRQERGYDLTADQLYSLLQHHLYRENQPSLVVRANRRATRSRMQRAIELSLNDPQHQGSQMQRAIEASLNYPQPSNEPRVSLPPEPIDGDGSCSVCMEGTAEYVVAMCGHKCLCQTCADKVTSCPLCRKPKTVTMRIYQNDAGPSDSKAEPRADPDTKPKQASKPKPVANRKQLITKKLCKPNPKCEQRIPKEKKPEPEAKCKRRNPHLRPRESWAM